MGIVVLICFVSPTWDTHIRKAIIGGVTIVPWTLRTSRKQTSDWLNVVRFSVAACGKEHCVTTQKRLRWRATQNGSWRLFGPLVLLEFCSKRNYYNLRICCRGVLAPVKSTICYGKYIYLFKQNPWLILTFYEAKNMDSLISSNVANKNIKGYAY